MNRFEQEIYEENVRLYQEARNPLRSHGPDHHLRVYENAKKLAEMIGVQYDSEILAGAALLHDLAAYYPETTGDAYHEHDHELAEQALRRIDFPKAKVAATLEVITYHGSDAKYKRDDEPVEVTLVRDADKLDAFGPIGCARLVMVRTMRGDTIQAMVKEFLDDGHLMRKWQSITFEEARRLGQEDYQYSKKFFELLAEKII